MPSSVRRVPATMPRASRESQIMKHLLVACILLGAGPLSSSTSAQSAAVAAAAPAAGAVTAVRGTAPAGYVIGAQDVLTIVFWREQALSAEVVVRPDGKISLPLLDDIEAAGRTPEELSALIEKNADKFIKDPDATVIVKEIRSRRVFVIGEVGKQGPVTLTSEMNVLQLLAEAGGLLEHANRDDIVIVRQEANRELRLKFNYGDVLKGKNLAQNILLKPGDIVVVR
jgi:polysaccharide biosynthesis/export protein